MANDEKRPKLKLLRVFTGVISLAGLFILYICYVGPFGEMPKAARVTMEKVADEENAWTEYKLAMEDLGATQTIIKDLPPMEKVVKGMEDLTDIDKAYLDKHQGAINHMIAGTKRPKTQFQSEPLNVSTKVPDLLQTRGVVNVATAQARRLIMEGKLREAADLDLTTFKMSTDMSADPHEIG